MTSGVCCIKNKKTDRMYIGLSKNIKERWKQHCKKSEQSIRIDRIINQEDKNKVIINYLHDQDLSWRIL